MEQLATCREDALEAYLDTGMVPEELVRQLVRQRLVFPCWFGSGLKLEGIDEFLEGLARYVEPPAYPAAFSARVFKISHDAQGKRLTHLKVTGGTLRVRDAISYGGRQEKAAQLRIYTGGRFRPVDQVPAGGICAVQGLTATWGGQGLGEREEAVRPVLEPVMRYRMALPPDCDSRVLLPQLRQLEEEDPQLRFTAQDGELHVSLMGRVQAEILRSLVAQRFGVEVELDRGRVLYKETIDAPVEGVGHYEPLRHYAEVHLLLEPLPQGSGLVLATRCPEDDLDRSWQRLIMTHLQEKTHLGVLTGSPVTDMKITLMSGRAHIKHTEGGDFRQATYRAVRQGLMQARSRLLEPYYAFRLEVPPEQLGRAISDVRLRSGSFDAPEEAGDMTLLRGRVPVTEFDDYAQEVASYTGGRGRLSLEPAGYGPCHNPDAVIAAADYDPEADLENTPDSVFCAHGGGFPVKWNRVAEYMHLPGCLEKPRDEEAPARRRCIRLDDAELEAIMAREFGPVRRPLYRAPEKRETLPDTGLREIGQRYYVVDGYNVIRPGAADGHPVRLGRLYPHPGGSGVRRLQGPRQPGGEARLSRHPCGVHQGAGDRRHVHRAVFAAGGEKRPRLGGDLRRADPAVGGADGGHAHVLGGVWPPGGGGIGPDPGVYRPDAPVRRQHHRPADEAHMKKLGVFQEHPIFLRPLFLKKYPPTGLVRGHHPAEIYAAPAHRPSGGHRRDRYTRRLISSVLELQ